MHPIRCRCGTLQGEVLPGGLTNRLLCYCTDCQAFGRYFSRRYGPQAQMLDAQGGSDIVQVAASRVRLTAGTAQLACLRLKPDGLLRWYARCCGTPLGNTLARPQMALVGLLSPCLDPAALARDFGPVTAQVHARHAVAPPRPANHGLPATIGRVLRIVLAERLSGRWRQSPLFTADGRPLAEPEVLRADTVLALKRPDALSA